MLRSKSSDHRMRWLEQSAAYLGRRIHVGAEFQQLSHNLHMALFRGQMESIQAILRKETKNLLNPFFHPPQ